jgi:hypothetical protein
MAIDQNEAFITNLLKVYKMRYATATTQAEKDQAVADGDALRKNAGAMGVTLNDSVWGVNVAWGDPRLPGGKKIDWGLLTRVGSLFANTNPTNDLSKWQQSVGTGLMGNLTGYQSQYATDTDQLAYDATGGKFTPPGGKTVTPQFSGVGTIVTPPTTVIPEVPQVPVTPNRTVEGLGQMGASQATALQGARPVKPTEAAATGMEWTQENMNSPWVQTPVKTIEITGAEDGLMGDPSMLAEFLKDSPDVVAPTDDAPWDVPTINRFVAWADNHISQTVQDAIITNGESYDPTTDPLWGAYEPLLIARDNATKASLKTALDLKVNALEQQKADVKANYDFQIAEIDNALNMANWASGQQLAASGVILSGALAWALTANEQQGINQKFLSVQERTNFLNKLSGDINILTQDYADQGTFIDKIRIAEVGLKRLELLKGNSEEVKAAKLLLLTLQEKEKALNIAAPSIMKAEQGAAAQAQDVFDFGLAADILTIQNTTGMKMTKVNGQWVSDVEPNGAQIAAMAAGGWRFDAATKTWKEAPTSAQRIVWEAKGYKYDETTGDFTYNISNDPERLDMLRDAGWLEADGKTIKADIRNNQIIMSNLRANNFDIDASGKLIVRTGPVLAEQIRNNNMSDAQATAALEAQMLAAGFEKDSKGKWKYTGVGQGGATDTSKPYMNDEAGFKADMSIATNAAELGTNNYQQAVLRLGLGSGGLLSTDEAFLMALNGMPKSKVPSWWASLSGNTPFGGMAGVLGTADEATVMRLADIVDEKSPVRALELYVAWKYRQYRATTQGTVVTSAYITEQAKTIGATLGFSAGDIATATQWLIANSQTIGGA